MAKIKYVAEMIVYKQSFLLISFLHYISALKQINQMNYKTKNIIYWISTGLMCALFLFSAVMYITRTAEVKGFFQLLNYPTYLVFPLATAKILGIIAVLSNKSKLLKEWAYAGFFFDAVLATMSHIDAKDGSEMMAIAAIILVIVSRLFWKK
jgi:hypothetical protein